jgi:hypothetical protein
VARRQNIDTPSCDLYSGGGEGGTLSAWNH